VRRIGIIEAKMMMGLPENFNFPVSETQAMKQLGNSVAVDAIYEVAKNLVEHLENETTKLIDENRLAA
jgi:DNA (cytosine-5)-methyltransferase 1